MKRGGGVHTVPAATGRVHDVRALLAALGEPPKMTHRE